jgi:hypothetical protein
VAGEGSGHRGVLVMRQYRHAPLLDARTTGHLAF